MNGSSLRLKERLGLPGLAAGDYVILTGISSLERDGSDLKPIIRLRGPEGIRKLD
jgi:hypothetical protein